jgi:hypothetical protein
MYTIGNQVFPSRWEPKCSLLIQIAYDYIHCNCVYNCSWFIVLYVYDCNLVYYNILELASKLRPIIVLKGIYFRHHLLGHDTRRVSGEPHSEVSR